MTYVSENRHWLEPYLRDLQHRMDLDHWRIELIDQEPEDDCRAQVWLRKDSRWARILVGDAYEDDMSELRDSMVHELLHVHINAFDGLFDDVESHLGTPAWDVIEKRRHVELEHLIFALTRVIAPTMPLPKPKKKGKKA